MIEVVENGTPNFVSVPMRAQPGFALHHSTVHEAPIWPSSVDALDLRHQGNGRFLHAKFRGLGGLLRSGNRKVSPLVSGAAHRSSIASFTKPSTSEDIVPSHKARPTHYALHTFESLRVPSAGFGHHTPATMDLNNIKKQVSNLTLYDLKAGVRKMQNGRLEPPLL